MIKTRMAAFAVSAGLALWMSCSPALASSAIDQQFLGPQDSTITSSASGRVAQTFTAGMSGALTRIEVQAGRTADIGSVTIGVFHTTAGLPTGAALASQVLAQSTVSLFNNPMATALLSIEFSSSASVESGTQYALVVSPGTGGVNLGMASCATYSAGSALSEFQSQWALVPGPSSCFGDLLFSTYVTVAASTGPVPPPVIQQFGRPAAGTCADAASSTLNWAGVPSGGWADSWAEWMNSGTGGFVCTRTLVYSSTLEKWVLA